MTKKMEAADAFTKVLQDLTVIRTLMTGIHRMQYSMLLGSSLLDPVKGLPPAKHHKKEDTAGVQFLQTRAINSGGKLKIRN